MGFYFRTWNGWTIVDGYIPTLSSNPDQGFSISATSTLAGSNPLYALDWNSNTNRASGSIGSGNSAQLIIWVPDEISVTTLYLTSRNDQQYTHPPQYYSLEWRAVWEGRETIKEKTAVTFTTYNETIELPINDDGKYSFLRLTLWAGNTSYVALQALNIDAVVWWVKPSPTIGSEYDFTTMTTYEFGDLFTVIWANVTLTEWVGASIGSPYGFYIDTGFSAMDYEWIEIYYVGYKTSGSIGYFSWVNDTVVTGSSNYYWGLAIHWWTYDNSNTAWAINWSFISNVSGRAKPKSEYRFVYTFSTWAWQAQEDWVTYATWTYSNPSFVTDRLNNNIVLEMCTNGSGTAIIEKAGFVLF